MDFNLSAEQQEIKRVVREFAVEQLGPYSAQWAEEGIFPRENLSKLGALGLTGINIPEPYGGAGLSRLEAAMIFEELCHGCSETSALMMTHNMVANLINQFGTEEQRQKWVVPLAKGEKWGAFGLTEPEAGSDAGSLKTTARRDGEYFIINGTKSFITAGGAADLYVVMARTGEPGDRQAISAIVVEKGTDGFTFGKNEKKMGYHMSPTCQLFFENCRVPASNLLGKPGEGFKIAMTALDGGRINVGALAVGLSQVSMEAAIRYAQERKQFGAQIGSFQAIQFMLADMATDIETARLLLHKAAWLLDQNKKDVKVFSMAKRYATDMAMRVTTNAVQIFGGYGFMREYQVERLMRLAKMTQIVEGTNEIQRIVIARNLMQEYSID